MEAVGWSLESSWVPFCPTRRVFYPQRSYVGLDGTDLTRTGLDPKRLEKARAVWGYVRGQNHAWKKTCEENSNMNP